MINIAGMRDYKQFLRELIAHRKKVGTQNALAKAMGCQPAYLTRVLNGDADLSLDQIHSASRFFGLTNIEREFWIFLNLENRSVDAELKKYFRLKRNQVISEHQRIGHRIENSTKLETPVEEIYYAQWHLAAIHMATMLPRLKSAHDISDYLRIPLKKVNDSLSDLERLGILRLTSKGFQTTQARLHLGSDSRHIGRHHTNWRLKTVEKLNNGIDSGLHYTSIISCSKIDEERIREELIACIQKIRKIVEGSKDEGICHYAF